MSFLGLLCPEIIFASHVTDLFRGEETEEDDGDEHKEEDDDDDMTESKQENPDLVVLFNVTLVSLSYIKKFKNQGTVFIFFPFVCLYNNYHTQLFQVIIFKLSNR